MKIPEACDRDVRVPPGNGQYDVELRLLYGRSLCPNIHSHCSVEAGYTPEIYGRNTADGAAWTLAVTYQTR